MRTFLFSQHPTSLVAASDEKNRMNFLHLTLPTAAEICAHEALLEEAELAGQPLERLRLWESPQAMVVVGRSSRVGDEVRVDVCRAQVPVLRRVSGGATIVAGPGCLMYAVVLSYQLRPQSAEPESRTTAMCSAR